MVAKPVTGHSVFSRALLAPGDVGIGTHSARGRHSTCAMAPKPMEYEITDGRRGDETLAQQPPRESSRVRRPPYRNSGYKPSDDANHTGLKAPWGYSAPRGTAPRHGPRRGFRPTNEPPTCSCVGHEVEQLDAVAVTTKIPAIEGHETPLAVGQHGRDDVRIVNLTTSHRHRAA